MGDETHKCYSLDHVDLIVQSNFFFLLLIYYLSSIQMSKRSANDTQDGQPFPKTQASGNRREAPMIDERGEFEDAWEDEIESDEEIANANAEENEDGLQTYKTSKILVLIYFSITVGMDVDDVLPAIEESDEVPQEPRVYIPGTHTLGKDEILEPDDSVYIMRHSMNVNWPCLSFDILRDNLGDERQRFPATAYIVAGTQADEISKNEVVVYKMSSLHRTQKDGGERII